MKIKKGDQVLIIKGKDKGRKGKVIQVLPNKSQVVIEGLNLRKKTVKPKKSGEKGQIIELAYPMAVNNVKLLCSTCQKGVRVTFQKNNGKKNRICQKCKQLI